MSWVVPGGVFSGGGEHLDLIRRDAHILRQTGQAQLHDGLSRPLRLEAAEEEKVLVLVVQPRHDALVDQVGVADDGGLLGLAEDLGQTHHRHDAAADQVVKEPTRPYAGQLIRVAHQHGNGLP